MGQAKIVSGGPLGKYNIELIYDTTRATARVAAIDKRIAEIPDLITAQDLIVTNAKIKADADEYDLTVVITAYNAGTKTFGDVQAATEVLNKSIAAWKTADQLSAKLKLEKTSLEMEKARLEELMSEVAMDNIWCADKTQDLAPGAIVGTAELNGELCDDPIIMPGGKAGQGKLQPAWSGTPAGTFFNWALLPWWQKRKPTYRAGVITVIDYTADTCSVRLLDANSSELGQGLDINEEDLDGWDDVPVEYMSCNAAAFKVGDAVLVELTGQSWDSPKVVGFINNPKPCSLLVSIAFENSQSIAEFVTLANNRIAALQSEKAHAAYHKDVFIPQILAHYDSLVGCYRATALGMFPYGLVTQAVADGWKAPWIAWRDSTQGTNHNLGYNSYVAAIDKAIESWTQASLASLFGGWYIYSKYTGGLDPSRDDPGHSIHGAAVINVDCEDIDPQQNITSPSGATEFQVARNLSNATQILWGTLDAAVAPICDGSFYINDLIAFNYQARGALDKNGEFYFLTTGFEAEYLGAEPPETTEFMLAQGDGTVVFRYPSAHNYCALHTSLKGVLGTEIEFPLTISVSGRLPNASTSFGGLIKAPTITGLIIIDIGGPYSTDPLSWCGSFLRELSEIPLGFEYFAGQYNDHPIVTGVDITTPVTMTDDEKMVSLTEVNNAVNSGYTYREDEEDYDHWRFLGNGYNAGDCEDFALTKIQMLLDAGWSIASLRLQCGYRYISYATPIYDADGYEIKKKVGHAWVLVDGSTVLDSSGGLKTGADMSTYLERRTQRGLVWTIDDTGEQYTAIPWPHTAFNCGMLTMNAKAQKVPP